MKQKRKNKPTDPENPEWGVAEFARARPATEVLPEIIGNEAASNLLKKSGPSKSAKSKSLVSLRLSPEVLDYFKATGRGWQTRIEKTLRKAAGL